MKHLMLVGLAVGALFVMGIATATSALATLPDISVALSGATYPLHLEVTLLTVATSIEFFDGERIGGEGVLLLYSLGALDHLGTYEALFTRFKKGTAGCFSEEGGKKDPSEEILTKGTWHLVYTSLAGSTQGLQLGILYLVSPVAVKCGSEEIDVKGDTLSSVDSLAGTETEEYTTLGGILKGNGEGVSNINFFYNEAGMSVKVKLEQNDGSGFKEAMWEIQELVSVTASEDEMFVVTSR